MFIQQRPSFARRIRAISTMIVEYQPSQGRSSKRCPFANILVRSFFASSTDHTQLLKNAEVHRIKIDSQAVTQYVLVPDGTDLDVVKKVPQLHVARIWLDAADGRTNANSMPTIFGAKVINRTLGNMQDVCARLVDAALDDARQAITDSKNMIEARATLHGLSDWTVDTIRPHNLAENPAIQHLRDANIDLLREIALAGDRNSQRQLQQSETYDEEWWQLLAMEYVKAGLSDESKLYESFGGTLRQILNDCDTSDFANTSGGAMAIFQLK